MSDDQPKWMKRFKTSTEWQRFSPRMNRSYVVMRATKVKAKRIVYISVSQRAAFDAFTVNCIFYGRNRRTADFCLQILGRRHRNCSILLQYAFVLLWILSLTWSCWWIKTIRFSFAALFYDGLAPLEIIKSWKTFNLKCHSNSFFSLCIRFIYQFHRFIWN